MASNSSQGPNHSPASLASDQHPSPTNHYPRIGEQRGTSKTENGNSHSSNAAGSSTSTAGGEKRVPLACHRCRAKRARCSGDKPVCQACKKASEECTWPSGRKRKRTRREMEADEQLEREAAAAAAQNPAMTQQNQNHPGAYMPPEKRVNDGSVAWNLPDNPMNGNSNPPWHYPPPPAYPSYVWPPAHQPQQPHPIPPDQPMASLSDGLSHHEQQAQLVKALEGQVALIEGDPSRHEDLELYYYRFSGSTAIHPGINRISLKLHPRTSNTLQASVAAPLPSATSTPSSPPHPAIMFDANGQPLPSVYIPLLDTFFKTLARHFPSVSRKRMEERLETGTMSAFLLNCICALSARFHPSASDSPLKDCAPFITKAQELIIPLLQLPTTDSVTGLLFLAWANYGQNSESGLWQYSGMAIRMALDLGLHEVSEIYETPAHVVRTRLLFWSLFVTDRIVAFSTGRPVSISEDIIEIPLPTDEDLSPDPARTNDPAAFQEPVQANAFQYLVKLLVLCGRIANVLNGTRGRPRTLVGPTVTNPHMLGDLQTQLVQFYSELPEPMKWTVDAFRHQEARGHGGVFLTLHLWANAVLALVYHPELMMNPSGMATPLSSSMHRSMKLSLASSRLISECLVFADLFASQSYLASPFAVQPIYVASLAFTHDIKLTMMGIHPEQQSQDEPRTADVILSSLARQSLSVLMRALQRMEHYWAGVSYVSNVLEQKTNGLIPPDPDASPRSKKRTFISLPDKGLLRRFTDGKNLPHNTAPPTETSLRLAVMKENAQNTYSLDDLLSMYSVEGMFVQPADSFDLESLLSSTYRTTQVPSPSSSAHV